MCHFSRAVLQRAASEHAFPALLLLVGLVAPLLTDSPVDGSRRSLDLGGNQIESVADVTWPSSLWYLILGDNPLGCFQGVPEHVVIDHDFFTRSSRSPGLLIFSFSRSLAFSLFRPFAV
jgi:hypothetical protein